MMLLSKRAFKLIFLAALCLYGLYYAMTYGLANAWYYKAEFALENWQKQGGINDSSEYQEALAAIIKAQELSPEHPHYAHMRGRVLHWGVDNQLEDKDKLEQVKSWYLLATRLRPLWPDPWIDLTRLNNYLHGYNVDTRAYLAQALKTGPYIDIVTQGTMQVLLLNWDSLSGEEKGLLFEQFAIATKQVKVLQPVMAFAKSISREHLLCVQLKFKSEYANLKKSGVYRRYCAAK